MLPVRTLEAHRYLVLANSDKKKSLVDDDLRGTRGWLKPKALTWIPWEVKPSKAEMIPGWVTFLALDFQCTLPPMVYLIIVGVYIFNHPCGNLGACPWGR